MTRSFFSREEDFEAVVTMFAEKPDDFPKVGSIGDIVFLHRVDFHLHMGKCIPLRCGIFFSGDFLIPDGCSL